MKLSIYTFVKNGLFQDYHVVGMLRHHLPLADEIIVNEGYSTDGTYEAISRLDPKIRITRTHWGQATSFDWFLNFKNEARRQCTGDWCILLDCDEFIPEWEFERLRRYLERTADVLIPTRLINFYANYKVYHRYPEKVNWPARKMTIHRNLPEMEVWGDGSNVGLRGQGERWDTSAEEFVVHHFGFVRSAARLREKWRNLQGNLHNAKRKWLRVPSFVFNWFPHNWLDPQFLPDLAVHEGPFLKVVRDNRSEFVRDGFKVYDHLTRGERCAASPA
jgi:glycosyltransferase involved in cell wall biosynthesis